MAGAFPHTCKCCGATVHAPVWDIAQPASGKSVAVCTRCIEHVRFRTDGLVWFPDHCPSQPVRPRFRLLTSVEGE